MINNPHFSNFKLQFESDFFKSNVIAKYDLWLNVEKYNIGSMAEFVNQTIQSITLPSLGFEPIIQQVVAKGGTIEKGTNSVKPKESLVEDKTFTVTLKHVDGFMNYFLLFELYMAYQMNTNGKEKDYSKVPDMSISVYNAHKQVLFTFIMTGVQFLRLDELELSKSSIHTEFTTFTCNFRYDSFKLQFHTPEPENTLN